MKIGAPIKLSTSLRLLNKRDPRVILTLCDEVTYRRFRSIEPSLVGCLDELNDTGNAVVQLLMVLCDSVTAGVVSLITQTNQQRKSPRNAYGRIDLVITDPHFRGLGIGRLLVQAALVQLFEVDEARLYSVSCLAAHEAIEHILTQNEFQTTQRTNMNYKHQELKLDGVDFDELTKTLIRRASEASRLASYRLRQRDRETAHGR